LPGIGTAGGAFAGAAAGAQVGMFRQQLAGTADYAASIGKLQIALRGVVGSQAAYDAAIRSAAAATRDLNIPQEEATRGLTRLSAAVIGAGGTVADSSFAFRAMSEAIKATGGNAEQVDGALLALTQVFSKGKVSAEELNQIAERLPGTFTLFAQAAGKTGPELQKALEQGEVGLNDLMKFLDLTSKRYGTTALTIAGSSQDAGARLTVAFQAMRLEVGKALQPLGAELQETFTAFIKDITPAVVGSAKAIAAVLSFFTNNEAAAGLAKFGLQLGAVALAIKALQAASTGLAALNLASWFTTTAAAAKVTSSGMEVAATKTGLFSAAAGGLLSVLSKLAALGVVTVGVTYIERRIKEAGGIQTLAEREGAGGAARQFQGATREVVVAAQVAQRKEAYKQQQRSTRLQKDIAKNSLLYQIPVVSAILAQTFTEQQTRLGYEQRFTQGVLGLDPKKFPVEAPRSEFKLPSDKDTKDKAADKARRDAEAAAAAQQQQNEAIAKAKIALDDAVFRNGMELIRKKYEYEQELEGKKRDLFVRSQTGAARETAGLISGFLGELETLTNRLTEAGQGVETATQELKSAKLMAATTVGSAAATAGIGAATLPGSISGRLDASGQNGADMPVGVNNAIKSYHDGVVKSLGTAGNNGNYIVVNFIDDLGNLLEATYSHVAAMVKVGDRVVGGQTIGRFDASGRTTGPHNSIDINSPGNNGSFQRNRETAAARRSADRLVRGRVQGAAGRHPTGVAAAIRRDIAAEGGVSTAEVNLDKAKTLQALAAKQVKDLTAVAGQAFVLDFTDALRQQNAALSDGASITELRNKLQLAGERPETIDAEIRKAEAIQRSTQQTDLAAKALKALDDAGLGGSVAATSLRDGIAAQNAEIAKFKELTDAATASQIAFNEAMRTRQDDRIGLGIKEGALAYVESVGTMREATAQLTQNGIKGLEDQLFSLVTTGKANFQEFAAEILKQSARMILQLTIQRVVMQIIGAIGGGGAPLGFGGAKDPLGAGGAFWKNANGNAFAKNNIVPYAMGGAFTNSVVSKPTLFKFANGGTTRTGLMGEAGPEAIMPLSRGANGKLGVASVGGGGTTNVVVNVDASGNSQVAGDQTQGAQLGRVISQAVQEELIKQRRPGGLLSA
jgi:lambda family phage tail tape measure protein